MYEVQCFKCMLVEDGAPVKLPVFHLGSSESVRELISELAKGVDREHFWVIYLNGMNEITGYEEVAKGGAHGCALTPSDVLRGAIIHGSSAIILGHNHPSNDPTPSEADIKMTRQIKAVASELGVHVLDHVIVTRTGFSSMLEEGIIS